ncbi:MULTISPECIES: carbohydrate ABC transporter permease [unclassified Amycolatopsis]|uniref:carbohydrate ABC transporter permease n=1 Tax=unclassified Amycolatopsis TaxID=2618356 RepID=UPI001FF1E509|nr:MULTISPECIES: sugar ABC transporter permease [unclassified Amycolatopsis]UOZ07330.1 sugar ABC transporter permease [Amycolatopsis sp. WQ 127309]WSJ73578.1 sugar ABC transporter permease [Amycolatopsis sp. NBC_01307]WSK82767.1 sugar ABC transporter permease [Amycolatopsis sp. NBC_01286]
MATVTTTAARDRGTRAAGAAHLRRKKRLFWPFAAPALVLYLAFLVLPTLATVVLSFTSWAGAGDTPKPNGVTNYTQMWASDSFQYAFRNTLVYVFLGGIGTFAIAFLFTMVLRDMRGGKVVRAILFFPNIVAPVALGMFLGFVFKYQPGKQGLANYVLEHVGADAAKFLAPANVTGVVTASLIWASSGFYITILMAAVDRIPPYLYEDAELGGASPWQKFRNITLPMTWDVVGVAGVLWTINALKIFELVFVLAGPGTYAPPNQAWTLGIYVFDRTFGSNGTPDFGAACACAVAMIALVSILVVLLRRLMRRDAIQF